MIPLKSNQRLYLSEAFPPIVQQLKPPHLYKSNGCSSICDYVFLGIGLWMHFQVTHLAGTELIWWGGTRKNGRTKKASKPSPYVMGAILPLMGAISSSPVIKERACQRILTPSLYKLSYKVKVKEIPLCYREMHFIACYSQSTIDSLIWALILRFFLHTFDVS